MLGKVDVVVSSVAWWAEVAWWAVLGFVAAPEVYICDTSFGSELFCAINLLKCCL